MLDSPAPNRNRPSGCLEFIVLAIVCLGIVVLMLIRHISTLTSTIDPNQARTAALVGVGIQFLALTTLLFPLALFWPSPLRRIYQVLLLAHGFALFLSPILLVNPSSTQLQSCLQIGLGIVFFLLVPRLLSWLPQFSDHREQDAQDDNPDGTQFRILWPVIVLVTSLV